MSETHLPRLLRLGAYATIIRGDTILLSRLASYVSATEMWTLPGGGVEHGEDPADAVVREVYEETGLHVQVSERPRVDSLHDARGRGPDGPLDRHAVRLVYEGWVPKDSPAPHVVEVDGSTVDAAWHRLTDIHSGALAVVPLVRAAIGWQQPARRQRLAAYVLVSRHRGGGREVLLTRVSALGHHAGAWTLPGGGVEHGERPADAAAREVREETGLDVAVGDVLGVHDTHFTGTAPSGRDEDYHGVHVVYEGTVRREPGESAANDDALTIHDVGGTTDAVAWHPAADVVGGRVPTLDVVRFALAQGG